MPISSTQIDAAIDQNLPDNDNRRNRANTVRGLLKVLTAWVRDAINANLLTFLREGSTTEPPTNAQNAYRTGRTFFGRSTDDGTVARTQFTGGVSLDGERLNNATLFGLARADAFLSTTTLDWNTLIRPGFYFIGGAGGWMANSNGPTETNGYGVIQVYSIGNSGGMMQVFTHAGMEQWTRISYFGWGPWTCTVRRGAITNRSINLFADADNDHQYYGIGVNPSAMRYQVAGPTADHVFYAATSPATSVEVGRLKGNGEGFQISGRLRTTGITATGASPTIAPGAALGGGTCSLEQANSLAGRIVLTTGANPTGADATLCTITYPSALPSVPRAIMLTAASSAGVIYEARVFPGGMSAASFALQAQTALPANTTGILNYLIIL